MSMKEFAKALQATNDTIPTIRTGTVVTDYGDPNTATYVSLDNDPTSQPVRAVTGQYLAAGTRVLLASYPPRGLAIIEVLSARAHQGGDWQFITTGAAQPFSESLVPAGTKAIRFLLNGGGGASGGLAATTAATNCAAAGGGAGGDTVEATLTVDGLQFPPTYTVGGGGVAGAAGNNPGGAGGSTTLAYTRYGTAVTLTAAGGLGGQGSGATATPFQVAGGNFSGQISGAGNAVGATLYPGQPGYPGIILSATTGWGGDGGMSYLGARQLEAAGAARQLNTATASLGGHRYGGGASGGFQNGTVAATSGSNGGAGVLAWQAIF